MTHKKMENLNTQQLGISVHIAIAQHPILVSDIRRVHDMNMKLARLLYNTIHNKTRQKKEREAKKI